MYSEELIIKNDINTISLILKEKFKEFKIPFYHVSHADVENFISDKPYVLWILGNEEHKNFDFKFKDENCKAIIKPYPYIKDYNPVTPPYFYDDNTKKVFIKVEKEDERVLNIPLGQTKNFILQKEVQRDIPVGFYGQRSGIRNAILPQIPFIKGFTYEKFGISREANEYINFLSRCDVSFCPTGQSPETYRLYESALMKCALLGTSLPYTEYYKDCPIYTLPWQEFNSKNKELIFNIVEFILVNKDKLQLEAYKWSSKWTDTNFICHLILSHLNKLSI